MKKIIPLHSLVIGIGPCAKSRNDLISRYFPKYEVISLETVALELLGTSAEPEFAPFSQTLYAEVYHRATRKLELGERVVINEPNLIRSDRAALARLGSEFGVPVFYLTSDPHGADDEQMRDFRAAERDIMRGDGMAEIIDWRVHIPAPVQKDKPDFDRLRSEWSGVTIVADVHGMLQSVLSAISWARSRNHYLIFLGDIVDYGADTLETADEVYRIVMRGQGELILGNHERKISTWIAASGRPPRLTDGNRVTTSALEAMGDKRRRQWESRFTGLLAHASYWREIDNIVVAHGGIIPSFWTGGVCRSEVEKFCLFGEVTGFRDDHKPVRAYSWTDSVPVDTTVIVGHDIRSTNYPVQVKNKNGGTVVFLDTGCGKGGHLSSMDLKFSDTGFRASNFNVH